MTGKNTTEALQAHNTQVDQLEAGQRVVGAITLDLNIFDADGNVVDGTTADLTREQASDIIDHASQLTLVRRAGGDINAVLDELEEALVAADVIDTDDSATTRLYVQKADSEDDEDLPVAGVTADGRKVYHCYHRDDDMLLEYHFTLDPEAVHGEAIMDTRGQFDACDVPKEFIDTAKQPIDWVLAALNNGWEPDAPAAAAKPRPNRP